jgi:hypothetical protein
MDLIVRPSYTTSLLDVLMRPLRRRYEGVSLAFEHAIDKSV